MASLDFLLSRAAAATKCVRKTVEAAGVVMAIKHVGTGTSTPTVVLSDTSSDITLTDGDGTVITADLSNASYNTVGEVADWINADASWECKILDALRSDASNDVWTNGSITASVNTFGETVFNVTQLIASAMLEVRVTYDESVGNLKPKGAHRVTLNGFSTYATCTGGAGEIKIYDCYKGTETEIWQALGVNNTLLTYAEGNATYPFSGITATEGHDLVIVIGGTVTTAATTNYVQAEFTRE
jgi:hypothetical protein